MKKLLPLVGLTALMSLIAGILVSRMSWLAHTAIGVFRRHYQYYQFMKSWWQTALLFFVVLMLLMALQYRIRRKLSGTASILVQTGCILVALGGLYYTYLDFRHDLSHRWAGENLHLGFYIFWINWAIISVFMILGGKKTPVLPTEKDNNPASMP